MTKLKTFFRRLFAGSFKRMFGYIGTIHKETGKNRFIMFFDMIWCIFRYSVGYMDYRVFGFANKKKKNREEDAEIRSFCVMVILCHFRF